VSIRALPSYWSSWADAVRSIALQVNQMMDGRSNGVGAVTLDTSTAMTTVTDTRVAEDSIIVLMATTANAAAESPHVAVSAGQFIITHANNAQADRTFGYSIQG
jgi:hypothetical protein